MVLQDLARELRVKTWEQDYLMRDADGSERIRRARTTSLVSMRDTVVPLLGRINACIDQFGEPTPDARPTDWAIWPRPRWRRARSWTADREPELAPIH
jgi:hypothetical protein